MELKCKHCDYEWDYGGSQKFYATCPQCHYKVKIDKSILKVSDKEEKQ